MVKKMKQRAEFLGIIIIPHPFLARKIFKEIQIHESVPGNFAALFIEVLRYMRKHYPAISLWSSTPQNLSDSNKKT
jgi:flagellar biosynthesis protein FlhB